MNTSTSTLTSDKPPAVIVDIDGTVALHQEPNGELLRGHYDFDDVEIDRPNKPVIEVVEALRRIGNEVVFCTGRPAVDRHGNNIREKTTRWLAEHLGEWAATAPLLMRDAADNRPDSEVKHDLYLGRIAPHWRVSTVLDDRDSVVALWRELGLTCLQVAPGDF